MRFLFVLLILAAAAFGVTYFTIDSYNKPTMSLPTGMIARCLADMKDGERGYTGVTALSISSDGRMGLISGTEVVDSPPLRMPFLMVERKKGYRVTLYGQYRWRLTHRGDLPVASFEQTDYAPEAEIIRP